MRLELSGGRWEHVIPGEICCQWVPEGKGMADCESASKRMLILVPEEITGKLHRWSEACWLPRLAKCHTFEGSILVTV